jgi:hypothetical protein
MKGITMYELIRQLEEDGVLGREQCPEEYYWHWPVLQPEKLPEALKKNYETYGEIRYKGEQLLK